jgi:SagB-type dehydrogenase family enzyme
MVPATYLFLDALPLTANGKVDRQALPEPPEAAASAEEGPSAHRPELEQIRKLVLSVLCLQEIDPEVSLLEYGSTSIDMIRIVNRLDETLGYRPRIGDFYRNPTIIGLLRGYQSKTRQDMEAGRRSLAPEPGRTRLTVLTDPLERESFKRKQSGLRRFDENVPAYALGAMQGEDAISLYRNRRSCREFLQIPVPFTKLAAVLGNLGSMSVDGQAKYLFGSAGSSYPVQTYFYAKPRRVESLPAGAYYFDPVGRRLVLISGGACIDPEIYNYLINRPVFDSAAFSIFLVAQLDAIEPLYGDLAVSFATIEAGLMSQLLEMTAPSYVIGLCQIGGLETAGLRAPLALGPDHALVHSLAGGLIAEADELAHGKDSTEEWIEGKI